MWVADLVFNALMVAADLAVLRFRFGSLVWCSAAVILPAVIDPGFGTMRLAGHAIFFHAPVLLIVRSGALAPALLLVTLYVDAYHIEPYRLQVARHTMTSPQVARPLRVAIVADLQMETLGDYERRVLRTVLVQKPDLILMTGDYVQEPGGEAVRRGLNAYLREIGFGAPLGVFAVEGNCDPRGWQEILEGVGTAIDRETVDAGEVSITGVGLAVSFDSVHINNEVPERPGRFHIVIGHAPDFAMGLGGRTDLDLIAAGHTHGGQVQIPGIGPILTLSEAPWHEGRHMVGGAALFVSRGIGMERGRAPRLRFWCPPEILIIDVSPK